MPPCGKPHTAVATELPGGSSASGRFYFYNAIHCIVDCPTR